MGKLVFGMMQSLDGYVASVAGAVWMDSCVAGLASGLELPPPGDSLNRRFAITSTVWPAFCAVVVCASDALLGRRSAGVGCGRARLRGVVAGEAEMVVYHVARSVGAATRRSWRATSKRSCARLKAEVGEIDVAEVRTRGEPHRPRSHRRVSSLLPPVCAWSRQAVLRRCQAAPPTRRRSRRRGCGQADVRPYTGHALPPARCSRPRLK